MDKMINIYREYLKLEKRHSAHTIRNYLSDIAYYFNLFKDVKNIDSSLFSKENIEKFYHSLEGLDSKSVSRKISALKSLIEFIEKKYKVEFKEIELKNPKIRKKLPNVLSEEHLEQVIRSSQEHHRDEVVLCLLYECGLRVSEVSHLKWNDVSFVRNEIKISKGKGGKDRVVPFFDSLKANLKLLFKSRGEFVIENKNKKQLSTRGIYNIVRKYRLKSGLIQAMSPHTLRHSYATHLLKNGADLRSIQELLGHENLSTTQMYTHLNQDELIKAYDTFHPLSAKKITDK